MANQLPLLLLPSPVEVLRGKKGGGGDGPEPLTPERQHTRLGSRLIELEQAFQSREVTLQTTSVGVVPEDVLVLETAGTIDDFVKAVSKIDGFEFLAEYDEEDIPPDSDFFAEKKDKHLAYTGRVYLLFSNRKAFSHLRKLWQTWQNGDTFERGFTKWRDVFALLRDIRPWDVRDRLEETGVLADWEERVRQNEELIPCEVEFWYRTSIQRRHESSHRIRGMILQLGGEILAESSIEGIRYHGLAVKLPRQTVTTLLDAATRSEVKLVCAEEIQFFRSSGQVSLIKSEPSAPSSQPYQWELPTGTPFVALFDGLPIQRHQALEGRLIVDDPDQFEEMYPVATRKHGTSMSSLIIWGDLNSSQSRAISHPLYLRPIMKPTFPPEWTEQEPFEKFPDDVLTVDLIHRAVVRLYGTEELAGVAPTVAAVNLSIGLADRPFAGTLSPLARLLDWLAWRFQVLFIVSSGNHCPTIELGQPWSEVETPDLAKIALNRLTQDTRNRRLLSPAESINSLTIAGLHLDEDAAELPTGNLLECFPPGYPSPFNAHGPGYRRSIKPDIVAPAGRLHYRKPWTPRESRLQPIDSSRFHGHQSAAPGPTGGDLGHTTRIWGTSNAAALQSRAAALLAPTLEEMRRTEEGQVLQGISNGLLLKVLLIHQVRWGDLGTNVESAFRESASKPEIISSLIGFGGPGDWNIGECTQTRVTALGAGRLKADEGAEHRFPLPPSLSGKRGSRRLTVSLAWFSPVNPLSHRWRQAALWFEKPKSKLKVHRDGPDWQAVQRGTVQHDIFESESAAAFVDGDDIVIRVSCREDAPKLLDEVPYAIAVTLEVAESMKIDIYTEIRQRIRARARIVP